MMFLVLVICYLLQFSVAIADEISLDFLLKNHHKICEIISSSTAEMQLMQSYDYVPCTPALIGASAANLTATLAISNPLHACTLLEDNVRGKVALVSR